MINYELTCLPPARGFILYRLLAYVRTQVG